MDQHTRQHSLAAPELLLAPAWTLLPEGPAQGLGVVARDGRLPTSARWPTSRHAMRICRRWRCRSGC